MFIVRLRYQAPIQEVDKYIQAHREFLDVYFKKGLFLAAGPMKPRAGGIILALTNDRVRLEMVLKKDPLYLAEIADYELIEFTPSWHCDELKDIIKKAEGQLC